MYEGSILHQGPGLPPGDFASGADGLHAMTWGELVARLGAARDFRRIAAVRHHAGEGSFDPSSAFRLAVLGGGQPPINPFALGNGKAGRDKSSGVTINATTGD